MASKVGAPPTITRQDFAEIKSATKLYDLAVIKAIALRLLAHFERPFELERDADTQPFRPVLPDAVHGHPLERGKGSPSEDIRASSFSLVATQRPEPVVRLVDGQPQRGSLERHRWLFYHFAVGSASDGFTLSVAPEYGDPDLYVSAGGAACAARSRSIQ